MGAVRGKGEGGEDEEQAALLARLHLPMAASLGGELCGVVG